MEKITRTEAIERGLGYFWSEKPCRKYGHIGFRRTDAYSCYECDKARNRKWHSDNPEERKKKQKKFKDTNPDYWNEYNKKNPEVGARATKRYRQKYPEKHVAENARYAKRHPEKLRAYYRQRRKNNPAARIRSNLASRLAMAIRNSLGKKSASTMKLVGCTITELMIYLIGEYFDENGRVTVVETSTCAHCQKITDIPNRRRMMDYVEVCRACMRLICLECANKPCTPKMREIEMSEERAYRRAQYRKMLGV